MKSNFLIYTLILLSFMAVVVSGFILIHLLQSTGLIISALLSILWLLIAAGLIGSGKFRTRMREFQVWLRTKAVIFFPTHPYQNIDTALGEAVRGFLPTKERIKNFFILIAITLIFMAIAVGGIFAWQYFGTSKEEVKGETAGWQMYRNEEYGFEMKYPKDWVVQDKLPQKPKPAVSSENLGIFNNSLPESPKFILWINPLGFGLSPADIVYELASTEEGKLKIISRQEIPPVREGISNIDGHIIINSKTFEFGQDRYIFMFDFVQGGENYEPILDQMLSTFKFLEQVPASEEEGSAEVSPNIESSKRDLTRKTDLTQIVTVMEFYYSDNNAYLQSKIMPTSIGVLLPIAPVDPSTKSSYRWLDNTSSALTGCNSQSYCIWAELESGDFYVASEKGNKEISTRPTRCPCW